MRQSKEDLPETVLTEEQQDQYAAVYNFVSGAIQKACENCSTARFAPERIARAVAISGRLTLESATGIADRLAACQGLCEEVMTSSSGEETAVTMCHFPSEASQ